VDWLNDPTAWLGLGTLIALEIVLGIDNLIFIAILADKLPPRERDRARLIGLALALVMRLALLASISWLVTLARPLATVLGIALTGRDLILLVGGLFLISKATLELHERLEGVMQRKSQPTISAGFWATVTQIVVLDAVFSLDSVITAVGMVDHLAIMMIAVIIALGAMMAASGPLMRFVSAHPTVIVLCLGFLLMIGFSLLLEGFHVDIPKGYLYAAIGFSVLIEALNQVGQRNRRRALAAGQGQDLRARTADAVLRMLGAGRADVPAPAVAEVAPAAASIERPDAFTPAERDMIRGVFDLSERSVRSIMTPRHEVVWIDANAPADESRARIFDTGHGQYPVGRGSLNNLLGVATAAHLLRDLAERGFIDESTCSDQPLVVHEDLSVLKLLEHFRREGVHFAVVVDEYGHVEGVTTPTDVLEAIAGELPARGDESSPEAQRLPDGSWLLDGSISLRRASQLLGVGLPRSDEYETLAGYILSELGSLPPEGTVLERRGLRFEVQSIEGHRIGRVHVRRVASADLPLAAEGTPNPANIAP